MRRILPLPATVTVLLLLGGHASAQEGARREEQPAEAEPEPQLTKPPKLVQATPPVYPPEAAEAGLEASVKVRLHIDAEGNVSRAEVVEPVGDGFDEAAVTAAESYLFEPAEFDGVPGPIVVETVLHFVLEEEEEEEEEEEAPAPAPDLDELDPDAVGPPSHGGDYREPITIEGEALERGSRRRLAGVIVSISEIGLDAVTDERGRFYFHGVPPGTYRLIAVEERYDRFSRELVIEEGEAVDVRLWMRAKGGDPYETVVEGEREVLEVTRRTLQRRQLTTVPGTFGDPIRVIQSMPGMARSPFVTGFLVIRGSNPDDSGIYLDGHRIPQVFHFLGGPSVLSPEFLENIELYPGGFPARFGRAHGGIVSVETRSAKSDGVHGQADVDLLDAGGYVRFPVGERGALAMAGRRSYLDFMLGFFLPEPEPGSTLIVVPVYHDYQLRFDYDLESEGDATLFLIGSNDALEVVSEDTDQEEFSTLQSAIKFFRVIGSYRRPVGGELTLTLSPAYGRDVVRFAGGQVEADAPTTGVDIVENTLSYRMRVHGPLREGLALDVGLDLESRVTSYDLLVPIADNLPVDADDVDIPPEAISLNIDGYSAGLHADVGWDATSKLRLIPGVRFDGYLLQGKWRGSIDPRIAARYAIDRRWTAKGYAGIYHQPPRPEGFDRRFGNPALGLERALHVGTGAEYSPLKHWTIDGEVYYIDRAKLAQWTPDVRINPDTNMPERVNYRNSGDGDTVGLEVLIKREVTRRLFGWVSYTLSSSRMRRDPDDDYMPTAFDQRHVLNAVASYKTDGGWEFGARFRLASGTPTTEIVGSTYDVDENRYRPEFDAMRDARVKTFHQMDVRAERTWVFNTWMIGAYLDVQNLFNVENVEAIQYDYRYRDRAPVTGVPFVPTLGVRGQW